MRPQRQAGAGVRVIAVRAALIAMAAAVRVPTAILAIAMTVAAALVIVLHMKSAGRAWVTRLSAPSVKRWSTPSWHSRSWLHRPMVKR